MPARPPSPARASSSRTRSAAPAAPARRQPRQARAQQTVQRILAATRALIAAHGVEALTTNRIAEAAHVNIATLYQYFPHKEAVLDAQLAAYLAEMATALDMLLAGLDADAGIEDSTRAWTLGSMAWFRQTQGVLPALMQAGGRDPAAMPALRLLENRLMEAMRRFLMRRRAQLDVPDLDAAVYVAFHAASSVISRHLLAPGWLRDEEIVGEVVRLMLRYFGVRPARARTASPRR